MKASSWSSLTLPGQKGQLSAKRITSDHPHDAFWTRDHFGAFGFLFEFHGEVKAQGPTPRLHGFTLAVGGEPVQLRLTLHSERDLELFQVLSEDLVRCCCQLPKGQDAFERVTARLGQWQRLLSKDRSGLLSDQEVRGLFGELSFLEQELLPRFGARAIEFWNGPGGAPQDFAIGTTVFEVKTRSGAGPAKVRISSPEQLWAALPEMFLCVYFLAEGMPGGKSLVQLVQGVREAIKTSEFLPLFEQKLEAARYLDLPEYDSPLFRATQFQTFQVAEGFPAITPAAVPVGVSHVSYDLSLEHCMPYVASIDWPMVGVGGHD